MNAFIEVEARWCDTKVECDKLVDSATLIEVRQKLVYAEPKKHIVHIDSIKRFSVTFDRTIMVLRLYNKVVLYIDEECANILFELIKTKQFQSHGKSTLNKNIEVFKRIEAV